MANTIPIKQIAMTQENYEYMIEHGSVEINGVVYNYDPTVQYITDGIPYASPEDIPQNVSQLNNDADFVSGPRMMTAIASAQPDIREINEDDPRVITVATPLGYRVSITDSDIDTILNGVDVSVGASSQEMSEWLALHLVSHVVTQETGKVSFLLDAPLPDTWKMHYIVTKLNYSGPVPPLTYQIYGVTGIGGNSASLTRTDNAIGLSYTTEAENIISDFDNCYPWNKMRRETDEFGNVFIKIPKFYTQYTFDNGIKTTKICKYKLDNSWKLNPIFLDSSNNELDYFYIGAYNAGFSNNKLTSVSGVAPKVSMTRAQARSYATANGEGYQILDIWAVTAIQDLFTVEFATTNSQNIMKGVVSASAAVNTGTTDHLITASGSNVSNTDGKHSMRYRGIENFYGNIWQWVDGINILDNKTWVCYNPQNYADNTQTNYVELSYMNANSNGYVKSLGFDANNPFVQMPSAVGGGSNTYFCDYYYQASGWRVARFGGDWVYGSNAGLFSWSLHYASSDAGSYIGSRLVKKQRV